MKMLRNIKGLPLIYVPVFLSVCLIISVMQIGWSVVSSCDNAKASLSESYDALLTVSLKERTVNVYSDKGGVVGTENLNKSKINDAVISEVSKYSELTNVKYISETYYIGISDIMSSDSFGQMCDAVKSGGQFDYTAPVYIFDVMPIYQLGMIAVDDDTLMSVSDIKVSIFDGKENGVIIPRKMYESYGEPEKLVFGWGTYNRLTELPYAILDVKGVYDCEDKTACQRIYCDLDAWKAIFPLDQAPKDYGDLGAMDVYGLKALFATLDDPSRAEGVIRTLGKVLDPYDYLITADDYEYKFAASQINSIKNLALTVFIGGTGFSGIIFLFLLWYALKLREGEYYILRTLGMSPARVSFGMTAEFMLVIITALIFGLLISTMAGDTVCNAVNAMLESNLKATQNKFAEKIEFFKNKDELQAVFDGAVDSFRKIDTSLTYKTSAALAEWQIICTVLISLPLFACNSISAHRGLMKRRYE